MTVDMNKNIAPSNLLDGMAVFAGVINAGSFTAAAEAMGHSTSYISKAITRLEKRLNSRLLNRTTRTISLTDAGRAYYQRCNQIMIDADDATRSIGHLQKAPRGLLRVNAPVSFGSKYLLDVMPKFMQLYPEVNLEIEFNDRLIDVIAEGVDVVIRVGNNEDSSLVARKFAQSLGIVVASPDYLARRGTPVDAHELTQHDCIAYSLLPNPTVWDFLSNGKNTRINIQPRVMCDSAEIELSMAKQGVGITRIPLFACETEVERGELQVILEQYEQPKLGVYAVYPHRQYLTAKVRAFVDFLVEQFT